MKACIQVVRPHQFIKNGFIWLPLVFGYKVGDLHAVVQTFWAFAVFCFAAGGVYILNDLKDIKEDREHPTKRLRPLASGALSPSDAIGLLSILILVAALISFTLLPVMFAALLGAYLLLNVAYSFFLKNLAIIDVVCVAIGFVIRVFAGGIVAHVVISHWIIIMTFLLALFLALAKRRDDLLLSSNGHNTRKSLNGYNLEFVSLSMILMASVIIVSYILYCVSPEIQQRHGTTHLYLTALWVVVGILRYLQITFVEQRSGSPTLIFLKDPFMQTVVFCWMLTFVLLIYGSSHKV